MEEQTTTSEQTVPGQGVLPGMQSILEIESAVLPKPEQERFCWEFVTNGGKPGPAYKKAINQEASDDNARSYACKLLKKDNIKQRVLEIASIIQRKYEQEVLSYRLKGLTLDRAEMLTPEGNLKAFSDLTEEQRQILDVEFRLIDGEFKAMPILVSKDGSAAALQRMFAMNKENLALTGKDGTPLPASSVTIYLPANGRD